LASVYALKRPVIPPPAMTMSAVVSLVSFGKVGIETFASQVEVFFVAMCARYRRVHERMVSIKKEPPHGVEVQVFARESE
jgi:hypothetical protein